MVKPKNISLKRLIFIHSRPCYCHHLMNLKYLPNYINVCVIQTKSFIRCQKLQSRLGSISTTLHIIPKSQYVYLCTYNMYVYNMHLYIMRVYSHGFIHDPCYNNNNIVYYVF